MTLAAINFADPLMLTGLLAAGIPVALHLLNKVRSPIVKFPTLRFLRITAQKTSRKRQLQHWLLLLLRMAVFALIAMAVAGPLVKGASPTLAYGLIVLLLAGLGLLVLSAVFFNTAMNARRAPAAAAIIDSANPAGPGQTRGATSPGVSLALSAATILAGLFAAGYSLFGLGSDHFFSAGSGQFNGSSTACVILLDNSASMLAHQDSQSRAERARQYAKELITNTIRPAEVAVLPTNPGTSPLPTRLMPDPTSTLGTLEKLTTTGKATPMRALIKQAQDLLNSGNSANKMLIILSDLQRPAFSDAEVFSALQDKDTQVILMPSAKGNPPADVGITTFSLESGQPVVGSEVTFEVEVINNGDGAEVHDLELRVDGKAVPNAFAHVQLGPASRPESRATVKIPCRLPLAGSHLFTVALKDQADAMAWDDTRELVLNVADQIKVLVVGPGDTPGRGAAFFVSAALAPFSNGSGMGGVQNPQTAWSIQPGYKSLSSVQPADLTGVTAVFLCDLPAVPARLAEALKNYADHGGRVCWLLGPAVDGAAYNRDLAGPRNLLPSALAEPVVLPTGSVVDWVDTNSDVFANLFDSQDPFRSVVITGRWSMPGNAPQRGRILAKLADGSVLLTQHGLGKGDVFTLFTAPAGTWSNFATTVPFLPMLVRIALGDIGRMKHETSYDPGQTVEIPLPAGQSPQAPMAPMAPMAIELSTPTGGAPVNVEPIAGPQPRYAVSGDVTLDSGTYSWHTRDTKSTGQFVVNTPGEEADLFPADADALTQSIKTKKPAIIAYAPAELASSLQKQSEGSSLAPGVVAIVLMLAILEALLANRYKPTVKDITPTNAGAELPSPPATAAAA